MPCDDEELEEELDGARPEGKRRRRKSLQGRAKAALL
jgi:hypothetical protein